MIAVSATARDRQDAMTTISRVRSLHRKRQAMIRPIMIMNHTEVIVTPNAFRSSKN